MSDEKSVSSPIATGGSGTFFEQHVGAYFLAQLLVRGIPPILKDCQVWKVHFQTEQLGWSTDDVLVIGDGGEDRRRKLAAQVKRNFTVSSSDSVCRKAISDFWVDFQNREIFDPEFDRLALITLRGTNTLLDKFASLLDCARASADGADFERRLSVEGLLSKKARKQAEAVRAIIEGTSDEPLSDDDFWQFLCVLNVISLDLNTQTAQHEASIKTLLGQTATEPDSVAAAESTWNELIKIVGGAEGMPAAGGYGYEDLPEGLRTRHEALAPRPGGHLRQLMDHSTITLEGIQTRIADSVIIPREALEARILDSLEETQVTVISGAAGHGKSAVAKNIVEHIQDDYFCLAFRAEEFAKSHIDQALTEIQNSLTAKRLWGILAGQGRKVILVDGVERLLESSERKAFIDLLNEARDDRSLRIILTCRDYSVDTVKMSLLERVAVQHRVLDTPPFSDDELAQVIREIPRLSKAVDNPSLRELMRSPYFLNIAARIDWTEDKPLPDSEREFRGRCWSEVIRKDVEAKGGVPTKRAHVFVDLALRRAKELRPFVQCEDFDSEALQGLRKDDLVAFSEESPSLAAPAHDVLEDWAIIHWLDSRFAIHERDASALSNDIGGYPALRRGYRKWLGEMLELDSEKMDAFVLSAFRDETLSSHFRDDTIISTLLSSSAENFLLRNRDELLADEGHLLVRVIHLLRVACKTTPFWLDGEQGLTSQLLVPTGTAWAPVISIVSDELEALLPQHFNVVLGLVEDWSQQVTYWNPKPAGYEDAGVIVVRLLEDLDDYSSNDLRERDLKILVKIPEAAPEAFKDLLQRGGSNDSRDKVAKEAAELLLTESNSSFACRFFPVEMTDLARSYLCLTEADVEKVLQDPHAYRHSPIGVEPQFGITPQTHYSFSVPSSALRGPFWPLLKWHPQIGIEFVIELMNHACSWYGEQKWPFDPLEPAWQTDLSKPGEDTTVTQWVNWRLYGMYREATVAPYVLQSALMALEKWLLEIAESDDVDLESCLVKLIRESNNVAVTAVVASVCIAHPDKCGRAGLALLTSRNIVQLDRSRMSHDQTSPSLTEVVPSMQPKNKIYDEERKKSDELIHRQRDLEYLAVKLQFDGLHDEVWKTIDQHREALPPREEQSDGDQTWRLALHRMDVRGFEISGEVPASEVDEEEPAEGKESDSEEDGKSERRYFEMALGGLEPDLEEMVERNEQNLTTKTEDLSLVNWGQKAWKRQLDNGARSWQEMLSDAQKRDSKAQGDRQKSNGIFEFTKGGPGFVAAVCVRDHWKDLKPESRSWCIQKLIEEIKRHEDIDDSATVASRGSTFPDRYAAYALPRVIREQGVEDTNDDVVHAMAIALTHSVDEVREYAAEGLGHYSRGILGSFAMRCASALAKQIQIISKAKKNQNTKPLQNQLRGRKLYRSIASEVRQNITSADEEMAQALNNTVDSRKWYGRPEAKLILSILGNQRESKVADRVHKQTAQAIVKCWERSRQKPHSMSGRHIHRNERYVDFEFWCASRIARFALRLEAVDAVELYKPFLDAVEAHPEKVAEILRRLIFEEDRIERETPFWEIWQAFADRISNAAWVKDLDGDYGIGMHGRKLLRIVLFGIQWKDDTRYWNRLQGQEHRVEDFIQEIPPSSAALQSYCRFLYHIGEESLPESFTVAVKQMKDGSTSQILNDSNTTYLLESLLRRYVYGEPLRLKSNPGARKAVLYILNELVEAGSSAAYQMRDDFVTPISPNAAA